MLASAGGCQVQPLTVDVEISLTADHASARRCPDGQALASTVIREWTQVGSQPRAVLHTSSPTAGTWWLEDVLNPDAGSIPVTVQLVFAEDDEQLPSITVNTSAWNAWFSEAGWTLYKHPDSAMVWTILANGSIGLQVCRTDLSAEVPETRCGDFSQPPATSGASSWHRTIRMVEGVPYLMAMKRVAVPYDDGWYCTGNLQGSEADENEPPSEIPFCIYRIVEGFSKLLDLTEAREGDLWLGADSDLLWEIDPGDPISMAASMPTGAEGEAVVLADLGAASGRASPHITRLTADGNGQLQRGDVSAGVDSLPTNLVPTTWNLQLGETPSRFVVAQTHQESSGGYQLNLYFADSFDLVWKSKTVERQIPADPSSIAPLLLQLEDFPITVSVLDGQLQRVDGATPLEPLAPAVDALTIAQAGPSHILIRYVDDTATLLRVTCEPSNAPNR